MSNNIEKLKEKINSLESKLLKQNAIIETLEKNEAKYRRLVEGLEDEYIIFSHDMEGQYLYISPSVKNILGVESEEFTGKGWHEIFQIPEESLKAGHLSDQICAQGKIPDPFELRVIRKDGREVIFETKERPLFDKNGTVIANEGIAKDITEQKRIEQELRSALEEIKTLRGIIPICSSCKKIRDDKGYWNQIEVYIQQHTLAEFSHSLCRECADTLYGNEEWYKKDKE